MSHQIDQLACDPSLLFSCCVSSILFYHEKLLSRHLGRGVDCVKSARRRLDQLWISIGTETVQHWFHDSCVDQLLDIGFIAYKARNRSTV